MLKARRYYEWTQEKASSVLNIARANIGAYEEGRSTPNPETLNVICEGYQINNVLKFLTDESFNMADDRVGSVENESLLDKKYSKAPVHIKRAIRELLGM